MELNLTNVDLDLYFSTQCCRQHSCLQIYDSFPSPILLAVRVGNGPAQRN